MKEADFANGFSLTCVPLAGNIDQIGDATALQMGNQVGVKLPIEQIDSATDGESSVISQRAASAKRPGFTEETVTPRRTAPSRRSGRAIPG